MKKSLIIIALLALSLSAYATTRAIVFDFSVEGTKQSVGKDAASYLRTAIAYMDDFSTVDPSVTQKLCDSENVASHKVGKSTAVKIARNSHSSANLAAIGSVERSGSSYKVTVTYIDVTTGNILTTKSVSGTGIYSISRSIDKIVGLLK